MSVSHHKSYVSYIHVFIFYENFAFQNIPFGDHLSRRYLSSSHALLILEFRILPLIFEKLFIWQIGKTSCSSYFHWALKLWNLFYCVSEFLEIHDIRKFQNQKALADPYAPEVKNRVWYCRGSVIKRLNDERETWRIVSKEETIKKLQ